MRLIDFNTSTADLDINLTVAVEINHQVHPISELTLVSNNIILMANLHYKPLTLDQLRTRVRELNPDAHFYFMNTNQRMFGYRLEGKFILIG